MPIVKPLLAIEVAPQESEVNPLQLPENNCNLGEVIAEPTDPRAMVGFVVWAVKLYHKSYTAGPVQGATVVDEALARYIFPVTGLQVVADVNEAAPAQSSFAGGLSVTQMSNANVAPVLEWTLI